MPKNVVYSDEYTPDFGVPWPELNTSKMTDEELREHVAARLRIEEASKLDPINFGWTLPSWRSVMKEWGNYNKHCILGGNRACVRGDTPIYDPVLDKTRRIDEIRGEHHVWAWDGTKLVIAKASQPFTKPAGEMLSIRLSNGQTVVAALDHWFLKSDLTWICARELKQGCALYLPASNSGTCQSVHALDARRLSGTAQDSQSDCRPESRLHDAQPLSGQDSGPSAFPLQGDAQGHTSVSDSICRWLWRLSVHLDERRGDAPGTTPVDSHISSSGFLLSIRDGLRLLVARCAGTLYRVSYKLCKSAWRSRARQESEGCLQSTAESCPRQSKSESVQSGNQSCCNEAFVESIASAGIEVKWDMTVSTYCNYVAQGVIHHNTKTSFAARLVVDAAIKIPEAKIRCWHVNEEKSIAEQQAIIWDNLPARFKDMGKKKGVNFSIQYSQKNGFAGSKLILPPLPGYTKGSEIQFNFYQQYRNDAQIAEGWSSHLIWCDEECPQKLFETLQYRIVDLNGRIFLTFTTLNGWTPLVADICARKKVLSKRYSKLLDREIPYEEESLSRAGMRLYYFWTEDNPFIPTKQFLSDLKSRPPEEKLARAHGIPTKAATSKFPKFDESVHVLEKMPWQDDPDDRKNYTRYMVVDPAGNKPWFMIWAAIDTLNRVYIYKEWPDESFGMWAEPAETPEGKPGLAQKPLGYGIDDYTEIMDEAEQDDEIMERLIDPRLSQAKTPSRDGATTLLTELEDAGYTFIPAPGIDIEDGISLINDRLSYDITQPIGATNSPKLYISKNCVNVIDAFKNYSGYSREEAWKDPIDCIRYLLVSGANHADNDGIVDTGKTFSYG